MAIESELVCFLQSPGESLAGFAVATPVALVPRAAPVALVPRAAGAGVPSSATKKSFDHLRSKLQSF